MGEMEGDSTVKVRQGKAHRNLQQVSVILLDIKVKGKIGKSTKLVMVMVLAVGEDILVVLVQLDFMGKEVEDRAIFVKAVMDLQ